MNKFLRILLILVIIIIVVAGSFFLFIEVRGVPKYAVKDPGIHIQSTPARVERGRVIISALCADCHKDRNTGKLTGRDIDPLHKLPFGLMYSQNITQDKNVGIGDWTDGQIIFLLRTGIKRDGQYAPPWMTKIPHMSDEDVASVISFLHSDDPMVKADPTPDRPCEPSFLAKFLCFVAFKPLPYPTEVVPQPDTINKVAWGKYLTYNFECYTCHSASFQSINSMEPPKTAGFMGGGNLVDSLHSANLTPDKETGIGNWTEAQFVRAFRFGLKDDGTTVRPPMVPFAMLSESEAKAIYAYLKTVPTIVNKVDRKAVRD